MIDRRWFAEMLPVTAIEHNGKVIVTVWAHNPIAWECDFGRLIAIRVKEEEGK